MTKIFSSFGTFFPPVYQFRVANCLYGNIPTEINYLKCHFSNKNSSPSVGFDLENAEHLIKFLRL